MNMKSFFLSSLLLASLAASSASANAQEFIVMPTQANNASSCQQENCATESASSITGSSTSSNSSNSSNSPSSNQTPGPSYSNGQHVQIDRSGMDKASIHLQIFQQTAPHLSETNQNKKQSPEDKKSNSKSQGLGTSVTEE